MGRRRCDPSPHGMGCEDDEIEGHMDSREGGNMRRRHKDDTTKKKGKSAKERESMKKEKKVNVEWSNML